MGSSTSTLEIVLQGQQPVSQIMSSSVTVVMVDTFREMVLGWLVEVTLSFFP